MSLSDLEKSLEWSGGKKWTDAYDRYSSPHSGYCEVDSFALNFELATDCGKYIFWIEELIGFEDDASATEIVETILPPAFAETEEAAKHGAILALVDLFRGPSLVVS